MRSFTDEVAGSIIFSKLDLTKAFHQILINPRDRQKTCITTPWGLFDFRRLSMGMKNSAQSFQRLIQDVLKDIPDIFVYLDDILVFSKDKTSHLKTVEEVLRRLSDAGLTLALSKCQFGLQELEYLGFLVNSEGIRPVDKKISAIITSQPPKKTKTTVSVLGSPILL